MKQYDSMFIQKNEAGNIYHLCYTDNTREVIGYAQFRELLPLTSYDADDGVYWFKSNRWMFAQPARVGAGGTNSKRIVLVHHANGATETDAQFWERQERLADYWQTVDEASYRSQ